MVRKKCEPVEPGLQDAEVTKVGRDVSGLPQEEFPDSPEACPYLSARDGNFSVMHP